MNGKRYCRHGNCNSYIKATCEYYMRVTTKKRERCQQTTWNKCLWPEHGWSRCAGALPVKQLLKMQGIPLHTDWPKLLYVVCVLALSCYRCLTTRNVIHFLLADVVPLWPKKANDKVLEVSRNLHLNLTVWLLLQCSSKSIGVYKTQGTAWQWRNICRAWKWKEERFVVLWQQRGYLCSAPLQFFHILSLGNGKKWV